MSTEIEDTTCADCGEHVEDCECDDTCERCGDSLSECACDDDPL